MLKVVQSEEQKWKVNYEGQKDVCFVLCCVISARFFDAFLMMCLAQAPL